MSSLNTYIVTFNCGRTLINTDFFAAHLFDGLKTRDAPPDLIVLCLQEVAPIAYSFLGTSWMAQYTNSFETATISALRKDFGATVAENFQLAQLQHVGMTAIMLLATNDLLGRLRRVDTAGVGVGLWEMGNKGAVGVRLWIDEQDEAVPVTFVAAHLAPMESAWERRNEDWKSICQRLVFTPSAHIQRSQEARSSEDQPLLDGSREVEYTGEQSMFSPASALLFAGDLNYRSTDLKPHPDDHKDWPAPLGTSADDYATMLKNDQLTREKASKKTLHLMDEADINFPPSYKYSSEAQKHALRLATGTVPAEASLWAEHRAPSWCDRILYLEEAQPKVHSYDVLPIQPTSDHRPVALFVSLSTKRLSSAAIKPPFSIDKAWRARRAAARGVEMLVGIAAYLSLTTEGRALLAGSIVGIIGIILTTRSLAG